MNENIDNNWSALTDKALIETIGGFVKNHRLNQNISQNDVAAAAGISRSTLSLLERGEKITLGSLIRVLRILDLLYVMDVFKVSDEISPLEYAKLKKKKRQRARKKNDSLTTDEGKKW